MICSQVATTFSGGTQRNFTSGTGAIFVSRLQCRPDGDFSDCIVMNDIGLSECSHNDDIGVECQAFCKPEQRPSPYGEYMWPETKSENKATERCKYGGIGDGGECSIDDAVDFTRVCNPYGVWEEPKYTLCYAKITRKICDIRNEEPVNDDNTLMKLQDFVSQINSTADQSTTNLNTISEIFKVVRNRASRNVITNASSILGSLQSWGRDNFIQSQSAQIVAYFEEMTLNLAESGGFMTEPLSVEMEEFVFHGENFETSRLKREGVSFKVGINQNGGLTSDTNASKSFSTEDISINLPLSIFKDLDVENVNALFSKYNSSVLLPLANQSNPAISVASSVLGATIVGQEIKDTAESINVTLRLDSEPSEALMCVVWDPDESNWIKGNCTLIRTTAQYVTCQCNHLSLFGVIVNTEPAQCVYGEERCEMFTKCCPIIPPLSLRVTDMAKQNLYNKRVTDNVATYTVELGAEFGIECSSVATNSGEIIGDITWYKSDGATNVTVPVIFPSFINSTRTTIIPSTAFENVTMDTPGQLYAYYNSKTSVELGTRTSVSPNGLNVTVGVSAVADGTYYCMVQTAANGTNVTSIIINTDGKVLSPPIYIRFTTENASTIRDLLNLPSEFVPAMFNTLILNEFFEVGKKVTVNCSRREISATDRFQCTAYPQDNQTTASELERAFQSVSLQLSPIIIGVDDDVNISVAGFCDHVRESSVYGTYTWPETKANDIHYLPCMYDSECEKIARGTVMRTCGSHDKWDLVMADTLRCITKVTFRLRCEIAMIEVTAENAEELANNLTTLLMTENVADQTSQNLVVVSDFLSNVTSLIEQREFNSSENLVNNSVSILDSISVWPENQLENDSPRIVNSSEMITENLVTQDTFNETLSEVQDQVELQGRRTNRSLLSQEGSQYTPELSGEANATNRINVPASVFEDIVADEVALVFGFYSTSVLFPLRINQTVTENSTHKAIGTSVIAASIVVGQDIDKLEDPVIITLEVTSQNWSNPVCVSYNFSEVDGNWTTNGCRLKSVDENIVYCECDHLTNFGVLVDVDARTSKPIDYKGLKVFSLIGSIISMVGLIITIITLLGFKKLRQRDANKFHVQLCIAVLCMLFIFLIGIDRTGNKIGCTICSVLIQYFTLASVAWMGATALLMFQKLIIVFVTVTKKHILISSVITWSVPVPFVVIALLTLASGENYLISEENFCFISHTGIFFGVFLGPVLLMVVINTVVFILVLRVLLKHCHRKMQDSSRQKKRVQDTLRAVFSIFSIMVMFGLQWLFGALTITKASLAFQWLFVIFSTFQGFILFTFFVVMASDAREEWRNVINRGRERGSQLSKSLFSSRKTKSKTDTLSSSVSRDTHSKTDATLSTATGSLSPKTSLADQATTVIKGESSCVYTNGHNDCEWESEEKESFEILPHALKPKSIMKHSDHDHPPIAAAAKKSHFELEKLGLDEDGKPYPDSRVEDQIAQPVKELIENYEEITQL